MAITTKNQKGEIFMDINQIKDTIIFQGMTESEIGDALKGLNAVTKYYKKGSTILFAGSKTKRMGLVLEGSVTIENNDIWGNKTILGYVGKNEFFAETYGMLSNEPMLVDVVANEDCTIVFLTIAALRSDAHGNKPWANKIIGNLLIISIQKNLALSGRSFHISHKTVRGRVMSYLNSESIRKGRMTFNIPFNRQQMADYLNLDRTALSKELGRMKREGLIDFNKNHFQIKEQMEI